MAYGAGSLRDASWIVDDAPSTVNAGVAVFASVVPLLLAGRPGWLGGCVPAAFGSRPWAGLAVGVLTATMVPLAATDTTTGLTLAVDAHLRRPTRRGASRVRVRRHRFFT